VKSLTLKLTVLLAVLVTADVAVRFLPRGRESPAATRPSVTRIDVSTVREIAVRGRAGKSLVMAADDSPAAGLLEAVSGMDPDFLLETEDLREFGLAGDEPLILELRMRNGTSRILRFGRTLPLDVMYTYFSSDEERKVYKVLKTYPGRIDKLLETAGKKPLP